MKKLFAGCALAALATSSAYAQSTASQQLDQQTIVVTGTKVTAVEGVQAPDTPKTREVLTADFIQHQTPGQAISDTINMMPGVSFQNNDSYGSGGGFLTIRGFDQSRISKTFDGIPLNDTGNYALYSNQDLDPELISQVSVSLGSTDIDSPTAAATGSTVNYITRNPTEDFHVRLQGSYGSFNMTRIFGAVDTGDITKFGTRLWVAASKQDYHTPYDDYGRIDKQQYNIKIYQPINSNGDFISIGGHFNKNNNNFFGSSPLRNDTTILNSANGQVIGTRVAGIDSSVNRFPSNADERTYYQNQLYYGFACQQPSPVAGTAQSLSTSFSAAGAPNSGSCGSLFDFRHNPSKTGNIRVNSRFSLTPKLILTVDPFYEYTDANGGGTMRASEGTSPLTVAGVTTPGVGAIGGTFFAGRDLNGDGDTLDTVLLLTPSNTVTNRYGVIANLLWNFSPTQTVRLNYTFDYGHHRQTGEASAITLNGQPINLFPHDDGAITDVNGGVLQKRNRLSLAILNQVAGQYRGKFFEDKLTVDLGVRAAFFKRDLTQYCFTTSGGGFVDCLNSQAQNDAYGKSHPYFYNTATGVATGSALPQGRIYKFNKVLPVAGLTYQVAPKISVYGSFSEGIQVPGTDQLYNAFYYPQGVQNPKPETSYNFDFGVRMRSSKIQAQLAGWYTVFKDRIEQTYDPIVQLSTYTNLGTVHKYGIDGSIAYKVDNHFSVYTFGSYLKSKIMNDVRGGTCAANGINTLNGPVETACTPGAPIYYATAGKRESTAPTYTLGARVSGHFGPVDLGAQVKRTGPRYINDQNTPVYQTFTGVTPLRASGTVFYQVYGNKTPAYTVVDADIRISLKSIVHNDRTYLQLNATNLFDKFYVGAMSTSNATPSNTTTNFVNIGAPRAFSGTFVVGF